MDELARDFAHEREQIAAGLPVSELRMSRLETQAERLLDEVRPRGMVGRVLGFNPAAIVALVQLVLLILRLIRELRNQRNS